jgi:hypothetical protein
MMIMIICVVIHFWVSTKKYEKIKKYIKKIFRRNPKNNRSEKSPKSNVYELN